LNNKTVRASKAVNLKLPIRWRASDKCLWFAWGRGEAHTKDDAET